MHLTALDLQVEPVQGVRPAERLVQSGYPDGGVCLRHASERTLLSEICEVKESYKLGADAAGGEAGEMIGE
ncbi:hypothetical protein SAV14893_040020 [Streptomyces avermitilis]|uniref:Uncharacterized protein n=1 Tax=Streptomyces avermitilis TaxID=33903 RepID=A0A4D4M0V3_STRAX|nr:hypothetical protein SAVMC3_52020 [Streptomyces avermitilis]GDY64609.1 hypothetical protein SAV14893_040020 [Streptomyces avermitilis]GDY75208.1 hypothetical protein SAV31267_046930 [Streptomyces avermitilis]GDY84223.1 hypothetical protein SAVCW2_34220 [Streptomyces avermitilis]